MVPELTCPPWPGLSHGHRWGEPLVVTGVSAVRDGAGWEGRQPSGCGRFLHLRPFHLLLILDSVYSLQFFSPTFFPWRWKELQAL